MHRTDYEIPLFENIKALFKKAKNIRIGDIGIYQDALTVDMANDGIHTARYTTFVKVKAVAIFEKLVEVEVVEVTIMNSCNENIDALIKANLPKYINPKYIKWEIKETVANV